jgi:hypothetical protein
VNLLGSRRDILSSVAESLEFRLVSSGKGGGGEDERGGEEVIFLEDLLDMEVGGVWYGVSPGLGSG